MPLPTITTQLDMPRELWAQVSAQATIQGKQKREIVIDALEEYFAKRK